MPFDSTTFRQPSVTEPPQQPPEPPERGGGPRSIHVMIEIVERRTPAPKPRSHRFGTVVLVLLIIVMLAALAGCTALAP